MLNLQAQISKKSARPFLKSDGDRAALHPDTAREFLEIDDESDEEGYPRSSPQTKKMARKMLEIMHGVFPVYYAVSATDDGGIDIQTAKYGGMSVSVDCNVEDESLCIVILRGNGIALERFRETGDDACSAAFENTVGAKMSLLRDSLTGD